MPSRAGWPPPPPPDAVLRASKALPAAPPLVAAPAVPKVPPVVAPKREPPLVDPAPDDDCVPVVADRPGRRSAFEDVLARPLPGATWLPSVSEEKPDEPPPKMSLSTRASCRASPYLTR